MKRIDLYTVLFAVSLVLIPVIGFAQVAPPNPDDFTQILAFFVNALKGGDWSIVTYAGLVLAVSLARKLIGKVPKLDDFLATDLGGALLSIATVVPIAFLGADLAGQPVTFKLAVSALGGTLVAFTVLRKILRPLLALVPKVGPTLVAIIDFLSGVVPVATAAPKVVAVPPAGSASR